MHDQPEATEEEQEQSGERHREEDAMRGSDHEGVEVPPFDEEDDSHGPEAGA